MWLPGVYLPRGWDSGQRRFAARCFPREHAGVIVVGIGDDDAFLYPFRYTCAYERFSVCLRLVPRVCSAARILIRHVLSMSICPKTSPAAHDCVTPAYFCLVFRTFALTLPYLLVQVIVSGWPQKRKRKTWTSSVGRNVILY